MAERLRGRTMRGVFWSVADRFAQQSVGFIVSVVLARLLLPSEFGLMAMLSIVIAVSQVLVAGGFGSALIQKKDASHLDECSVFFFNIVVSGAIAGMLFFAAPLIARFYEMPPLVPMTRALSLNLVISAFGVVQVSLMTKRVDFKKQMKVSFASSVFAGIAGVSMATAGFGVWSLVWQAILGNLARVILLWRVHGWRPAWKFSLSSLRTMFAFGSKVLSIGLIDTIFKNVYLMVIGKVFSPADLGLYARAQSIQQLPVKDIAISSDLVSFPVFSSIQDDRERTRRGLRQGIMMQAVLNFPLMIGLACIAESFVRVLLTDKWLQSVPYIRLLCLAGLFYPLSVLNISALKARGRGDLFLRLELIKKVLIVFAIVATYQFGIMAMICGQVISSWIGYYLNSYYTARFLDYSLADQIIDVLPSLGVASLMGAAVFGMGFLGIEPPLLLLTMQVGVGVSLYLALCRSLRLAPFMDLVGLARAQWAALRSSEAVP